MRKQIADELEEEIDEISPLVEHVRKYTPVYDIEQMEIYPAHIVQLFGRHCTR